jgi:hypothetical protein
MILVEDNRLYSYIAVENLKDFFTNLARIKLGNDL